MRALQSRLSKRLSRRFEAWANQRHVDGLSTTLGHRNIYIVPSKAGLFYAVLLLTLLIGSINYQLNLGYLLTFVLAGVGAMSMHITHNNLRGLTLALKAPESTFAGSSAKLQLVLTAHKKYRYGIALWCRGSSVQSLVDVEPGAPSEANLQFFCPLRGIHAAPRITLETRFPLGLWRAWTHWQPSPAHGAQLVVYPMPEQPAPPLPPQTPVAGGAESTAHRQAASGEFDGVRAYRSGDALKQVVWKKFAKNDELVSRDDVSVVRSMLVLDFYATGVADTEKKLSRLAAWIQDCDRRDLPFELKLPGNGTSVNHSSSHTHSALRALAIFGA